MSDNSSNKAPSVYKRGMEDGTLLGALLVVVFGLSVASITLSQPMPLVALVCGLLSTVLTVAVPFVVYRWLKRDYLLYPAMRFFSATWMHGIVIFFCGGLLMAVVMFVFLRFISPDFILNYLRITIDAYRQLQGEVANAAQMADTLQQMIDKDLVPSAISFSLSMIWTVTFFGSILSLILTVIVRLLNKNKI